jgi:hypothetical protein
MYNDKLTLSIAEAAKKCMDEELKGQQHKIDVNKNNKIDAEDFKHLRAGKKPVEEAMQKADVPAYLRKQQGEKPLTVADVKGPRKDSISSKEGLAKLRNEETIEEADIEKTATGMKVYGSSYGNSVRARREQVKKAVDTVKGPKMKDIASIEAEKKTKKKFSEMVESYVQGGIQGLFEGWKKVKEEATNAEFKSELDKQQAKAEGKAPQADVAAPAVQAVQSEAVEQLDELSPGTLKSYVNKAKPEKISAQQERQSAREAGDYKTAGTAGDTVNKRTAGIKAAKAKLNAEGVEQVEERSMTDAEMKKREDIVKGMKKGIQGFKDRYGDKAKSVMYATATKQAMKESTQDHWQAGHDYAADHALDSGNRETARSRKKEMLADNPHPKGSAEHKEWHQGAMAGHQTGLDNL